MRLLTAVLDGKKIAYTDETEFIVQTGKGKGSYTANYICKNLGSAPVLARFIPTN